VKTFLKNWQLLGLIAGTAAGLVIGAAARGADAPMKNETADTPYEQFSGAWKDPAESPLLSLNFSPYYLPGDDPEYQTPLTEDAIRDALKAIAPYADTIRTFGVSGEMNRVYALARGVYPYRDSEEIKFVNKTGNETFSFRVIAGCWIGAGYAEEQIMYELDTLAELGNDGLADILVVGSEGLFRGDYTAADLIGWIGYVKDKLTADIPVGTSDTAGAYISDPELFTAVDVALYTYYPFFDGVHISRAIRDFEAMRRRLEAMAGETRLICSETGWKFEGTPVGDAEPGGAQAAEYFERVVEYARETHLEICYFEAIEEKVWKIKYDDAGWGLFDENLNIRPEVAETMGRIKEGRF